MSDRKAALMWALAQKDKVSPVAFATLIFLTVVACAEAILSDTVTDGVRDYLINTHGREPLELAFAELQAAGLIDSSKPWTHCINAGVRP